MPRDIVFTPNAAKPPPMYSAQPWNLTFSLQLAAVSVSQQRLAAGANSR